MKKSILLVFLLSAGYLAKSQVIPAWVKFAAPSNFANYDVQEVATAVDTSGNIYTAGSMIDTVANRSKAMLVKYNNAGVQQWIKFYDSSDPAYNGSYVTSLLVDKAGNSYVCGYGIHNNTSSKDFMVVKYDNMGFQIWAQYWDGAQNQADYPTCATFDAGGSIVVAGYANSFGTTGDDVAIVKWGISGTQQWSYQYNNSAANGEDRALSVASDKNNNIFITGSSYGTNARDMISIKVNNAGANQWTKRVPHSPGSNDDHGYSIIADTLGNSYVTGAVGDWITIKYDPAGSLLWTNIYTANGSNMYNYKKILLDKYNNPVVGGDAFFSGNNFSNLVVNKLNGSNGVSQWSTSFNFGGIDGFMDMVVDTMGYIYLAGKFEGPLGTDMSSAILNPLGASMWSTTFTNAMHAAGIDMPYKIAIDKNRNIIMTGVAETRGSGSGNAVDIITVKYGALVTGINEKSRDQILLSLYPNPSHGLLSVSITDSQLLGSMISIKNISGQLICEEKITALTQDFHLEAIAKGMYLVTISGTHASVTKKLVIE